MTYTITECQRQVAGYAAKIIQAEIDINEADIWDYVINRSEQCDWYDQNQQRWEQRLIDAGEAAIALWINIMAEWTDKQVLAWGFNEHNPYQSEAAERRLNLPDDPDDDELCDLCGEHWEHHQTIPASYSAWGWQPAEPGCPPPLDRE